MTMPTLPSRALLGCLVFASAVASAADAAPQAERAFGDAPLAMAAAHRGGAVVKHLPYSAEVISERQHNLADGNQIVNKHSSISYRDSAGRTRQEMRDDKGELRAITIHDPVAGASYFLNPRTKVATRLAPPMRLGEAARARMEQLRKDGKLPPPRNDIVIRRADSDEAVRVTADGNAALRIEAETISMRAGRPRELLLGPLAGAFSDIKWSRKAVSRELGVRDIDGVRAEGKLRSYEIPAGELGNRNAIVVSDESWFATELQITVLSKHSDPRSFEHTYRLTALKRDEPAASLFVVPADYTLREMAADGHGPEKRPEAPAR